MPRLAATDSATLDIIEQCSLTRVSHRDTEENMFKVECTLKSHIQAKQSDLRVILE